MAQQMATNKVNGVKELDSHHTSRHKDHRHSGGVGYSTWHGWGVGHGTTDTTNKVNGVDVQLKVLTTGGTGLTTCQDKTIGTAGDTAQ